MKLPSPRIEPASERTSPLKAMSLSSSVERLVASAASRFGRIDTLVNNAGVGVFADVASMSDDDWSRVLDTNLTGVFYCTRAVLPEIKKAGGGWIINIASLAGRNYFARGAAYCASKAGLIAFTESLMQEVADYEARFVQGEDEDAAGWVEYAYNAALDEQECPGRRWSDLED